MASKNIKTFENFVDEPFVFGPPKKVGLAYDYVPEVYDLRLYGQWVNPKAKLALDVPKMEHSSVAMSYLKLCYPTSRQLPYWFRDKHQNVTISERYEIMFQTGWVRTENIRCEGGAYQVYATGKKDSLTRFIFPFLERFSKSLNSITISVERSAVIKTLSRPESTIGNWKTFQIPLEIEAIYKYV